MQEAYDLIWGDRVSEEAVGDGNPRCEEAPREVTEREAQKFVQPEVEEEEGMQVFCLYDVNVSLSE